MVVDDGSTAASLLVAAGKGSWVRTSERHTDGIVGACGQPVSHW